MRRISTLVILFLGWKALVTNVSAQANPSAAILPLNAGGLVALGAVQDVKVTITNTLAGNIVAFKLRPNITIPALCTILPDAQQTGLPAGWSIVNNTGNGQIRVCNGTDVIGGNQSRDCIIKVQGLTVGGPTQCQVNIQFGGASCAVSGPQPNGNNTVDDAAQSTLTVIAAPPCNITSASASAGSILCNGGTTTLTVSSTNSGSFGTLEYSINGGAYQASPVFTVPAGSYTATVREASSTSCSATATAVVVSQPAAFSASGSFSPVSYIFIR